MSDNVGKKIDELTQIMKEGFESSDSKIDDLSKAMEKGFKDAEVRTDEKIDELARMIQNDVVDKMATKEDLHALEKKVDVIDENVKEINMKLYDMDETVRRNSRRVEKLEENAGIL